MPTIVANRCKGTYASIWPWRHTYGHYGYTVSNMDSSDTIYRCTGEFIVTSLSLMASQLYRMAIIRPQSYVTVTLFVSLGADLLGCINRAREEERKQKKALYIPAVYVLVWNHKSCDQLVMLNGGIGADLAHGKTPPPLPRGNNPCWCHLYRANVKRREEQQRETRKHQKVIPSPYLDFPTHSPMSIIPVAGISWRCSLLKSWGWLSFHECFRINGSFRCRYQ